MKTRFATLTIIAILISCQPPNTEEEAYSQLPNIVLIVGDDQGYPYFGFMGADYVETPNMDELAASGIVFTDGYVPDNHCRPSLQTLMTSTLPIQYKKDAENIRKTERLKQQGLDEEEMAKWESDFQFHAMKYFNTLPKILADYGYSSFQGGKWWEYNYQNGGFTHGMTTGWTPEDRAEGSSWFKKFMGGSGLELARATMEPVYEFVEQNAESPFFLWYAPELPHYPFDAPDKYYNIYADKDMTESAKRYYANCTWFDDGVGELMRFLKEKGEFDNTLFVYVNDNGWEQNPDQEFRHDSLRWHNGGDKGKLSIFDQSFRTPIIFSWEGKIEGGTRNSNLIHSADIPATVLDLIEKPIPDSYFGESYKDVISGKALSIRNEIFGNVTQMRWEEDMMGRKVDGYWVRTPEWFFKWNKTTEEVGLYDMYKDPSNNENLMDDNPELVADFQQRITDWRAQFD